MDTNLKLGKLAAQHDPRTLRLANYLTRKLPPLPKEIKPKRMIWGMFLNDKVGDCTCAAAAHLIRNWTMLSRGKPVPIPESKVLEAYSAVSGYDPETGENDDGAAEHDLLKHWRSVGIDGHKLWGWADTEPRNMEHVKAGIFLFGGLYSGVQLPLSAQGQPVWSIPPCGLSGDGEPGSWGGHAISAIAYNLMGPIVVSWNQLIQVTWGFWKHYVDESHAVISDDWLHNAGGITPTGLDLTQMQADVKAISQK